MPNGDDRKISGVSFDADSFEKLAQMAISDRRDRSAEICYLIQEEWARREAAKAEAANG